MYLFNSVGFADLFGTYVFAIDAADFWFLAFASVLLAVGSVFLARRPQPVPQVGHWTDGRYLTREDAVRAAKQRHPSGKS